MINNIAISVIIPTYNRAHLIKRAIESVLIQTVAPLEIIVVDDGSTDNTKEVVTSFKDKVKYLRTENKGVSSARNFGVKNSSGNWLSFLDSDDEWLNGKLEKQIKVIRDDSSLKLIHGDELWIRDGKRINQKKIHKKSGGDIYLNALELCLISPSAVIIEKELYLEHDGFDEDFIVCEDYDLWLKITASNRIGFIPEPIIKKYGGHSDQLSHKYKAMDYWRVKSMYNILKSNNLSSEYKQKTKEILTKKAKILLAGYLKHNNLKNFDEISNIISKVNS